MPAIMSPNRSRLREYPGSQSSMGQTERVIFQHRSHFGFGQQAKLQPEIKMEIENKIQEKSWTTITLDSSYNHVYS